MRLSGRDELPLTSAVQAPERLTGRSLPFLGVWVIASDFCTQG
jgi:hypothetical protein